MTMNASQAENLLALLYSASTVLSITSLISMVIAWQYWVRTLDVCINVNCGCILYGVSTFSTFMGGDAKLCHFSSYGLVPVIIISLCFGVYHGYRSCIPRTLDSPRTAMCLTTRGTSGRIVVIGPKSRSPCKQWIPAAFCAALISCLSLAHAVVITDGYYKTCKEYRKNLISLLGSRGNEAKVIRYRMSCDSVLDFMDYLQPDANNWRRGDNIDTGFALQLAIITSWLNFVVWLLVCCINLIMAKKRLNQLGEQLCCFC